MLALFMCLSLLGGCAENEKDAAVSFEDGGSLSVNFMYLLTSIQKAMYAGVVEQSGGDWNAVVDEKTNTTFSDLLYNVTLKSAQSSLICEYLHDTVYGLALTDEQKKSVDTQIAALTGEAGSKDKLKEQLSTYSADIKTLRRYLELTLKQGNLYNYFYGEGGKHEISDQTVQAYFKDNYHIVTHIYFNLSTKAKEDGTLISLTDEEKAEKRALAETVYNRILAGEDFDTLKAEFSEDTYESEYYPNGFFVTSDTAFPSEFTAAALEMKVGEYRLTESGGTGREGLHILYKLPMDESLYSSDNNVYLTIKNLLVSEDFESRIAGYADKISINDEQMSLLNVEVVPAYAY